MDLDGISDDELARLAMAADPDQPLDDDAVPFAVERGGAVLLPEWYMPVARGGRGGRTRRVVIATVVGALLVVNGAGLCVTYGLPEIAW